MRMSQRTWPPDQEPGPGAPPEREPPGREPPRDDPPVETPPEIEPPPEREPGQPPPEIRDPPPGPEIRVARAHAGAAQTPKATKSGNCSGGSNSGRHSRPASQVVPPTSQ